MSNIIEITVNGLPMQVESGQTLLQIIKDMEFGENPPLIAKVDNEITELINIISRPCDISLLDITHTDGFRVYQRTLSFLMIFAAREILGKDARIIIEHSINKNYYCEISGIALDEEILAEIEAKMSDIAEKNLAITKHRLSKNEGMEIAKNMNLHDKVRLMAYRTDSNVNFYKLDWLYGYFYGPMAPSTGVLKTFALKLQGEGFVLNFPKRENPSQLLDLKALTKISQVFRESNNWARILNIDTVGVLNDKISAGQAGDIIRVNEALHEKSIASIADSIHIAGKNIVLIAGPSSSGKTTFAARLSVQLRVNGMHPHIISLDDYYVDREKTPLDEFGKPNFESLYAIDVEQLSLDLKALLAGETVSMPRYNFLTGKREYKGSFLRLQKNDVLILEGIHGLNPKLADIPAAKTFKIFISALTQLNLDDHNRIPASDTRMIRRMVRDSQFRSFSVKTTIHLWPSVTRGETQNIFPFQEEADVIFNSALIYEMCILKLYAMPLLFGITKADPEYTEARRLLKFLDGFMGMVEKDVPNNSLLREFIGGGCFKH